MIRTVIIILLTFVSALSVTAAATPEPERVLVVSQGEIIAGRPLSFFIYYNNPNQTPIQANAIFKPVSCRISSGTKSQEIMAQPENQPSSDTAVAIPGNGYKKVGYKFTVPSNFHGNITMTLNGTPANTAVFSAQKATEEAYSGKQVSLDNSPLIHPFVKNFAAYKPMYFLLGVDPGTEKTSFQLSFRYHLFDEEGSLAQVAPWVTGFNLGYTQKSLWDLKADSAPFEDTSYMPEFFYLEDKIDLGVPWISAFGFQTGYQHESNGRDGDDSRSTNYAYFQPIMTFHLWDNYHLKLAPKAWVYINTDDATNGDLDNYRGYYEIESSIGDPNGAILKGLFRNADAGSSYQMDLSYPLNKFLGGNLDIYLHAQYFNGYAETLLNYDEKYHAFRLGISLVR